MLNNKVRETEKRRVTISLDSNLYTAFKSAINEVNNRYPDKKDISINKIQVLAFSEFLELAKDCNSEKLNVLLEDKYKYLKDKDYYDYNLSSKGSA